MKRSYKNKTMIKKVTLLTCLFLILATQVFAANHYIRAGASGSGNGNDWTNAYTALPATLTRGDTYYIADGSYPAYTFNDSLSGTTYIYIRKATVADHGSSTNWLDTYGDGEATFTNWDITTGYWDIDGITGSGKSGYGFVVHDGSTGGTALSIGNVSNVIIKHADLSTTVTTCDTVTNLTSVIYAANGGSNLTVRNSYLHESNSWAMLGIIGWNGVTFDGNYFLNACRKELLSARNDANLTFKNNVAENSAGTGIIVMQDPNGAYIYNNVFFTTNSSYTTTDCLICNWYGSGMKATNVDIYNNTFYNVQRQATIGFDGGTNITVKNNIFYGPNGINWYGTLTHDYNWCYPSGACSAVSSEAHGQIGTSSPFVNAAAGNFALSAATNAGVTLASPYTVDITGSTRGADAGWDRGAYEYISGLGLKIPLPPSDLH